MTQEAQINEAKAIMNFMFAGNSIFTLRSVSTDTRYTYKVVEAEKRDPKDPETFFLKVLTGPDNTRDYVYVGIIRERQFRTTAKSKMTPDSGPVKAFVWAFNQFKTGQKPSALEFYHIGRCGRCGRPLTVPESVATGIGPDCASQMGIDQVHLETKPEEKDWTPMAKEQAIGRTNRKAPEVKVFHLNSKDVEDTLARKAQVAYKPTQGNMDAGLVKRMVAWKRVNTPEEFYMDGEMDEATAVDFWTTRYSKMPLDDDRFWGDEAGRHEDAQEQKAFASDLDFQEFQASLRSKQ